MYIIHDHYTYSVLYPRLVTTPFCRTSFIFIDLGLSGWTQHVMNWYFNKMCDSILRAACHSFVLETYFSFSKKDQRERSFSCVADSRWFVQYGDKQ